MGSVLLDIGGIQIRSFGVFLLLGFLIAEYIVWREGSKKGYNEEKLLDLGIICFLYAFIFSRLGYVLLNLGAYSDNFLRIFAFWEGGLDFNFGLIGGLIGFYYFIRRNKWSFFEVADFFALAAFCGYFIGLIGNYLNNSAPIYNSSFLNSFFNIRGDNRVPSPVFELLTTLILLLGIFYLYIHKENFLLKGYLGTLTHNGRKRLYALFRRGSTDTILVSNDQKTEKAYPTPRTIKIKSGGVFFIAIILLLVSRTLFALFSNVNSFFLFFNLGMILISVLGLYLFHKEKLNQLEKGLSLVQASLKSVKLKVRRIRK